MGPHADTVKAGEVALVEVSLGRVLAFARNSTGYFAEMWSGDGGLTWSHSLLTDIWAPHSPDHLITY